MSSSAAAFPPIYHTVTADLTASREGQGTITFTVMRTGNTGVPSTVNWFVGGTVDAADFGGKLPTGRVSFAAGEFLKAIVLKPLDDNVVEDDETITVTLGALTGNGAVLGVPRQAAMTLTDNDLPPTVSIASAEVVEGGPGETRSVVFTLTRSGNIGGPTDVIWNVQPWDTSPDDFAGGVFPAESSVSFAPGAATTTISIAIAGDDRIEGDEDFIVNITAVKFGVNGETRAVGTIRSDDTDNRFSVAATTASLAEGNSGTQWVEFNVSRSGNTAAPASVRWALGGSVNADDLAPGTAFSGTLDFAPGVGSQLLRFELVGDTRTETDELLTLQLSGASGLGSGLDAVREASTTVLSDDAKYPVSVSAAHAAVAEGDSGAQQVHVFTLTRGGDPGEAAHIAWTLGGSVDAADFATGAYATSGTASFAPGAATTTLSFTTRGDTLYEPNETLVLSLGDGDLLTADAQHGSASVQLLNDDEPDEFRLSVLTPVLAEGSVPGARTSFRFEVTRAGHVDSAASVQYAVSGSGINPVNTADFGGRFPAGTMNWAPGETRKTLYIELLQDTAPEFDESFTLSLSMGVNAGVSPTLGSAQATVRSDELPAPRSVRGSSADNERVSLPGPRSGYTLSLDAASGAVKVVDQDPGRSGTTTLTGVEWLRFADQAQLKLAPDAGQTTLLQLGQALFGPPGLNDDLYALGSEALHTLDAKALAGEAAQAFFGDQDAAQMASAVLANLGLDATRLDAGSLLATRELLTHMFSGTDRGAALLTVVQTFAALAADPVYGAAAMAFNNRVGAEWLAEFAGHPATLAGLPDSWIDLTPL